MPFSLSHSLISSLLCFCIGVYALEARKTDEKRFHHLQITDLLPSAACKSSTNDARNGASLKVVHKHGPCSQLSENNGNAPNLEEMLVEDQIRVDSIHSKRSWGLDGKTAATKLPAQSGVSLGTANYFVTVGLGTPRQDLPLVFDTGSDLTWARCSQSEKFNPTASTSYANITCSSPFCSGENRACASSTCLYGVEYGDGSTTVGFLAKERLSLGKTDVFDNFYFGCSQKNDGFFDGEAGLIGLGRDKLSVVSQTASKYNQIFSYCLPSSSSTGFLSFGASQSKSANFTPLSKSSAASSFYDLDLIGITVGGKKLSIPASVFSTSGTIIDSGTVITRLPPAAYSALRSAFRTAMSKYPTAKPLALLDTCYDVSSYENISVPAIKLSFKGGIDFEVDVQGVLFGSGADQLCLAFAANKDARETGIFGNTQQKNHEVVYDVGGGKVGFAAGGCS